MYTGCEIHFDDLMLEQNSDPDLPYCQSKLANILFTAELARRLENTGITTYSLHPGVILTDMPRNLHWFRKGLVYVFSIFFKDIEHGAQTSICCAVDEKFGNESGLYYQDCARTELNDIAKSVESAKRLWEISEELVKLPKFSGTQT